MSGAEPKIQGGSQLATKYDVSGNVSAGRWVYSPYHNYLLPITGYQLATMQIGVFVEAPRTQGHGNARIGRGDASRTGSHDRMAIEFE